MGVNQMSTKDTTFPLHEVIEGLAIALVLEKISPGPWWHHLLVQLVILVGDYGRTERKGQRRA